MSDKSVMPAKGSSNRKRACSFEWCEKNAKLGGKCKTDRLFIERNESIIHDCSTDYYIGTLHGGGPRCKITSCPNGAKKGGYCIRHGGGVRCSAEGCSKSSQQASGYCRYHMGKVVSRLDM